MRMCVHYAITYPERGVSEGECLDLTKCGKLTFLPTDDKNFPMLDLARSSFKKGGLIPCVLNGANEAAVALFLDGKIRFTDIFDLVRDVTDNYSNIITPTLAEIAEADVRSRILLKEAANL